MLLPVLNYCAADEASAIATLKLCYKLDGQQDAALLLTHDGVCAESSPVRLAAESAFKRVHYRQLEPFKGERAWPGPQNHAWQQVARWLDAGGIGGSHRAWLWWEPDAVPLRAGWLAVLINAYAKGRQPFAGVPCSDSTTPFYLNGVGIYPMQCVEPLANCAALYTRAYAFDRIAGPEVKRAGYTDLSKLILHVPKRAGGGASASFQQDTLGALHKEHPEAVFLHGCTDTSVQSLLDPGIPRPAGRLSFYHSGDLGDVIYSLPAVRALGGGEMFMGPDNRTPMSSRERMTPERARLLVPLLELQPYMRGASYRAELPRNCSHDLNKMRLQLLDHNMKLQPLKTRLDMQPGFNLARCYLKMFDLDLNCDTAAWLKVEPLAKTPVVINRTPRYRENSQFRWDRVLKQYHGQVIFIGLPEEHASFTAQWGPVPFEPTSDLLMAARLIAGCELYVSNQSSCYCLAEGLKKSTIMEPPPEGSNNLFGRSDVIVGVDENTTLPTLGGQSRKQSRANKPWRVVGNIDWFRGLSRVTCQIAMGLNARKAKVSLQPLDGVDRRLPLPPAIEAILERGPSVDGPRILITGLGLLHARIQPSDIVLGMWESTRLPDNAVAALNKHASLIITPCRWCATTFSANGVNVPIKIVPLGVDLKVFKLQTRPPLEGIVIGAAGRVGHGGPRKGIEDVIKAFQMAFPSGKQARLKLKLFDDCYVPSFNDGRIEIELGTISDEAMADWYHSLSCFVCLAKGEGWGLHVHEALACGVPVIAPAYGGLADLVAPKLRFTLVKASESYAVNEGYQGHWCQPDLKHAAELMAAGASCPPLRPPPSVEDFTRGIMEAIS